MSVHYEAYVRMSEDGRQWKRLEVDPFSNFFAFDVEEAAIDRCRSNDIGYGFRVEQVETTRRVVWQRQPDGVEG